MEKMGKLNYSHNHQGLKAAVIKSRAISSEEGTGGWDIHLLCNAFI